MGKNSIKESLTKEDIIADIRMTLAADFNRVKSVVIVEGDDDITFFNGKLSSNVDLYESYSGKKGVEEIVDTFPDERVVGICDRDYGPVSNNPRIFYYDYCCLEMMLIANNDYLEQNPETAKAFLAAVAKGYELRTELLEDLAVLSLYRKLNEQNNWGINFRGLNFSQGFDEINCKISIPSIVAQIKKINTSNSEQIRIQLSSIGSEKQLLSSESDYLLITQGHDFINSLHQICLHSTPRKNGSPPAREMYRSLVCSYRIDDLHRTIFYSQISAYQDSTSRKIID